ncbi:MAG TPA: efflux RND transporter periplasmic adaptor subunit [Rhizomicrobium sp.]|jgi:membrane fusion protein (multidrug efflux system)|nr:efflux RND transporter periplasmic adaptor subunit [Rhizomicrobium sp.]
MFFVFRPDGALARRRTYSILALCLIALPLSSCGKTEQPKRPPPTVGVVTIKTEPVQLTAVLPGRTTPYAVSDVRPQVGGLLKARLFTEGALVKQGQPLYQIDPAPYQAAYNNAAAVLTAAKAKAARYAALLKQSAIAPQDYDDAVAAYKQAQANAQTARINLGYTRITAPISGRIGRSSVTPGALLTADQTTALATIQTLDPIYVDITQSASEVLALKLAMQHGSVNREPADAPATLTLDNGTQYSEQGKLQFAEVSVDQTTGSVSLRAIFPNPHGLLLPGMFVRATINEGVDNKAILAPQQGIGHNEKGNPTALVVDAHNMARLRVLKTSRAIGDKWLVTEGLKPGDRLIVEGTQNAQPDTPVTPAPASFLNSAKGG